MCGSMIWNFVIDPCHGFQSVVTWTSNRSITWEIFSNVNLALPQLLNKYLGGARQSVVTSPSCGRYACSSLKNIGKKGLSLEICKT